MRYYWRVLPRQRLVASTLRPDRSLTLRSDFCDAYLTHDSVRTLRRAASRREALSCRACKAKQTPRLNRARRRRCGSSTTPASSTSPTCATTTSSSWTCTWRSLRPRDCLIREGRPAFRSRRACLWTGLLACGRWAGRRRACLFLWEERRLATRSQPPSGHRRRLLPPGLRRATGLRPAGSRLACRRGCFHRARRPSGQLTLEPFSSFVWSTCNERWIAKCSDAVATQCAVRSPIVCSRVWRRAVS